jgi:hypothetical protein
MTPKVVTTILELVAVVRARRDELEITNGNIDDLAGLPDRYAAKLLSADPMRNFGDVSLRSVLGALALGMVVMVIHEDPEQAEKIAKRWVKKKRPQRLAVSALAKKRRECVANPIDQE